MNRSVVLASSATTSSTSEAVAISSGLVRVHPADPPRSSNTRRSGTEDGILTALEMASLDLGGTELAVLSACDTGVGDVLNGEGVYGLRRALVIAGAKSQVVSLWRVDDQSARHLMVGMYERLQLGMSPSQALRASQLELMKQGLKHPFYWAAFIASGTGASQPLSGPAKSERTP